MVTINVYDQEDETVANLNLESAPAFAVGQIFYVSRYLIKDISYSVQYTGPHSNFLLVELLR